MTYNIRDDNGTLLGTVDADTNGDLVIEHAQSGEQARLNDDGLDVSSLSTGEATIAENKSGVSSAGGLGQDGAFKVLNRETLADEESLLIQSFAGSRAGLVLVYKRDPNVSAPFAFSSDAVSLLSDHPDFAASDTDGNVCLFLSSGELILKNRTGGSHEFGVLFFGMGA